VPDRRRSATISDLPDPDAVLVVCTGNVCRSPYIALLLTALINRTDAATTNVESAGTRALVGARVDPEVVEALWGLGVDAGGWRGQQVTGDQIDRASLIVVASREHRTAVARMRPRALGRVFTLRQLVRLLEAARHEDGALPRLSAADLARRCALARGLTGPSAGADDDVPDPFGRTHADYVAAMDLMTPGVFALAAALA
jgi:protein-tyrosine phosphatase